MDDAHIVHLLRPRYPKIIQKGLGRSCPSVDGDHYPLIRPHPPARPTKRSGQKALSGLCCVRACPVSLISPLLDYVNEQWSSDLMSAPFPSHCPRPLDRGSNQAHTSEESSPRILSENNQGLCQRIPNKGSCQRIPKDRVTQEWSRSGLRGRGSLWVLQNCGALAGRGPRNKINKVRQWGHSCR